MTDKTCVQQVLGTLLQHPQIISQVDKYSLSMLDFSTKFEAYVFSAIVNLYQRGSTKISPIDVENYLSSDKVAESVFRSKNGIEYLQDAEELSQIDSFPYYYDKLKKINLLNDLKKSGHDISAYYEEDATSPRALEVNAQFEKLTIRDIIDAEKKKLLRLEADYDRSEEVQVESISEGIDDFINELGNGQELGFPVQGHIYTQVINGAERKALTIRSAASSVGKTRHAVADACLLAFPIRFNSELQRWEQNGSTHKVLFIITEQTFTQIRKMVLAYLTDINESRFKFKDFFPEEEIVIQQAKELLKKYANNFIVVKMPNPTIELVKSVVRENCLTRNIDHVFYDYIFIGPALLNEFRGFNIRNDEVLLMMATALKDLAVELNVSMMTSTQVNANVDDNRNIRNEASLAGGRSTINKADNGAIMARPTKEELTALEPVSARYGVPNLVTDIFKVRSGEWTQIRIWSKANLGTMRRVDLFVTDANLEPIEGFFDERAADVTVWEDDEYNELIKEIEEMNKEINK